MQIHQQFKYQVFSKCQYFQIKLHIFSIFQSDHQFEHNYHFGQTTSFATSSISQVLFFVEEVTKSSADFIQTSHNPVSLYQLLIIMKTGLAIAAVALLLVSTLAGGNCPLDQSKQPIIYSDSVGLNAQANNNSGNAQNLVYNYQFQKPLSSTPSVAIGLNQIQASQSPVLDLQVTNPRTSPTGLYFQAQSGDQSQWKNFKINFMATTRSDMQLGSISTKLPLVNPNDNTFNMIYSLKKDLPSSGLKLNHFLQGINVQSKNKGQIGIRKESSMISNRQIFFTFSSPVKSSIIRALTISIVVYNIYTPGMLYADGIIDQNYVVSKTQVTIPRHGINELRTYMVGINSFETSASKPISIYSALSQTFQLQIGPIDRNEIDFVSVSYLILSVVDCGSCEGNPILFEGICQPICPPGYRADKGRCVPQKCQEGQALVYGKCIPICRGVNQMYYSGTCVCLQDFYRIDGICQKCQEGNYYDFKTGSCRPLCGLNSIYRGGRCYCNAGFYIINNRCQQCNYGTRYDASIQRCVNICQQNQVYSPAGCVCANGYNRINGVCARCPYNRVFDPDAGKCVCKQGLQLVYDQCLPACGTNQVRFEGTCVCIKGTYPVGGGCNRCWPNSYYSPAHLDCICQQGYKKTPYGCFPDCRVDQFFQNGQCVNICRDYEIYVNGKCQCDLDSERVNGVCKRKCLAYEYRNENGTCLCIAGYYKGGYPMCQKVNCPAGTSFDEVRADCITVCKGNQVYINGACVCRYGYNSANAYGQCVLNCSPSQISVNGLCQCAPGYVRVALGVCIYQISGPGKCPPGSVYIFGQCLPPTLCRANQYWCGFECVCANGFYRVNGQCVPVQPTYTCPFFSKSNGVNCMCDPGYYPIIAGRCDRCPSGTYWDGHQCAYPGGGYPGGIIPGGGPISCQPGWTWHPIQNCCYQTASCPINQEWDGASCRCKQGFYWIQGSCQTCPTGTVFDGYRCTAGVNYCRDPYSFWNGNSCVCLPGYWPLAGGKCITCPQNTAWDGTCCQPTVGGFPTVAPYPF